MRPILVAYDGSEGAKRALDVAAGRANGSPLTVVSVAELLPQFGRAGAMLLPEEDEDRKRQLAEAMEVLKARGIEAKAVERRGDPAEAIVDEAQQEDAELIVVGTRGLNAAKRWLMGSVSTRVVQHAPCNVLVVR